MTPQLIQKVEREKLTVEAIGGDALVLRFTGVLREQKPEDWLAEFLDSIFEAAYIYQTIVLDIRGLKYMNATAFRVFIPWLHVLSDLNPDCSLQLRYLSRVKWQNLTATMLQAVASHLIVSEPDED